MKKVFTSLLGLLLTVTLMVSALTVSCFAAGEPQTSLAVDVTTNRNSFPTLGVATFKVKVTNISQKVVVTVGAELLGGQLAPLGSNSVITAESAFLLPGESIGFTFKATMNKEVVALNELQRLGLNFVRLWYKNIPVVDNSFDDGRIHADTSKSLRFGSCVVSAVIRVWYADEETIVGDDIPEVVAFYNERANAMKTYTSNVTVTKRAGTTSKIYYIDGGSDVRNYAENFLRSDYRPEPTLTFVNGLSGAKTLAEYLPRRFSNLMSELNPSEANGVKYATLTPGSDSNTVTIVMNYDITSGPTALADKPAYISLCMDTLNLHPEDLRPFTLENATATYYGCKIEAVFDSRDRLTKLDITTPVRIRGDLKNMFIRLKDTEILGTYNGNYTFAY